MTHLCYWLFIYYMISGHVPLKVLSIETGDVLQVFLFYFILFYQKETLHHPNGGGGFNFPFALFGFFSLTKGHSAKVLQIETGEGFRV